MKRIVEIIALLLSLVGLFSCTEKSFDNDVLDHKCSTTAPADTVYCGIFVDLSIGYKYDLTVTSSYYDKLGTYRYLLQFDRTDGQCTAGCAFTADSWDIEGNPVNFAILHEFQFFYESPIKKITTLHYSSDVCTNTEISIKKTSSGYDVTVSTTRNNGGIVTNPYFIPEPPITMETVSFKYSDDAVTSPWIDLGLPSGNLWRAFNLGTNRPYDFGNYYAWGETEPKEDYSWSTYKFWNGSMTKDRDYEVHSMTAYHNAWNDRILSLEDDAAYAVFGENDNTITCIPSHSDWCELFDNTNRTYVVHDETGHILLKVTPKDTTSKVALYFPCAGIMDGTKWLYSTWSRTTERFGNAGWYWSDGQKLLNAADAPYDEANVWEFDQFEFRQGYDIHISYNYHLDRCYGASIRPIRKSKATAKRS